MNIQNLDPKGINGLLSVVSSKLGMSPEKLKASLRKESLIKHLQE